VPSGLGRRGVAAVATFVAMALVSHLLLPAVTPEYAVYGRFATYLFGFSVWMAWFVDWLAVWLGQEDHPSEREDAPGEGAPGDRRS